jgi:hypothetical protein
MVSSLAVQRMASIMEKNDEIWRVAEANLFDGGGMVIIDILKPLESF